MMKTPKLYLFATLVLGTLSFTSCKNPCKDADCVNGTCSEDPNDRREAVCTCSVGYETENCSKGINEKLVGTFAVDEVCTVNGQRNYSASITAKSGSRYEFVIAGLYNRGQQYTVTAVIGASGNSFTIAKQKLGTTSFDIQVDNGTLTSDGKSLSMEYVVTFQDTIPGETCIATLTR